MEESCSEKSPKRSSQPQSSSELFVCKTPGNSSSGYANTFRILENQIRRKQSKHSDLFSISEEEPSFLELELAARSRLTELCDTNVDSSESIISLNKHLKKFDSVQNYIYHVSKSKSGALTLKPKHLIPSSVNDAVDNYGKLNFLLLRFIAVFQHPERFKHLAPNVDTKTSENIRISHFPMFSRLVTKHSAFERKSPFLTTYITS